MSIDAADFVIVGGGSAGAALAARLSEDAATRVVLIEAGPVGPLPDDADLLSNVSFALTARDWGMSAAARPERQLAYPQGKALGGGSSVNGALAFRGAPGDFDGWAARGNPSWSWDQMLPAFIALEHDLDLGATSPIHGSDGPVPVVRWSDDELLPIQRAFRDECLALGLPWTADHNAPDATGVGAFPMNRVDGRRISTALGYLLPILDRPNLEILGRTQVIKVDIVDGRAVGVQIRRDGSTESIAAGEVVLSSGSIHSPATLLRSGIGSAQALAELGIDCVVDNPNVGANLVDHPGVFLFYAPGRIPVVAPDPQFQIGARYTSAAATVPDDMFLSMMNYWDLTDSPDFRAHLGVDAVLVLTCGVHEPRSRGRVTLSSTDPTVAPTIDLNLLDDDADTARLVEGMRRAATIASSEAMADFVDRRLLLDDATLDDDARLADYVRSVVAPWYHPVGTCRMGPADAGDAVVDDQLRVHGIEGLRVADASIMPSITRAPTNLTSIAIGERAAQLLR